MNVESPVTAGHGAGGDKTRAPRPGAPRRRHAGRDEAAFHAARDAQPSDPGGPGARADATEAAIAAALAEQRGLGHVDLAAAPPDPDLLIAADAPAYLLHGILPWRRMGRVTTYAVTDPDRAAEAIAHLNARPDLACIVVTTRSGLESAVSHALGPALAERAAARTPPGFSVRGIAGLRRRALLGLVALAALMAFGGPVALGLGLMMLFAVNAATGGLRLLALFAGSAAGIARGAARPRRRTPPPMISILVPLYREANMIGELVAALSRLDYPRDRLEVRLLLEASDMPTREAVARADLPRWIRPMIVPEGSPRTKPRALNHALDFCRGEIVGILDAEDRPDPDQLRAVVHALESAGPGTACVQCQLSYYNARQNWVSRCFQMEYAIWFEVLLPGFRALGLPIPLGGTSVYFRRDVVAAIGGWDAHNVTEDADLGMRLARAGCRTAVLRSVTEEEANCRLTPWIRQRSRWLKGYMLTWLSHMRDPRRLRRELGLRGFLGLNLLFVGAVTAYLAMPLFWTAVVLWALEGSPAWRIWLPDWVVVPALVSMAAGQVVMLACATLAMMRRGSPDLLWWVPTLPVYWTLGALAAWKAVAELVAAPFYWDKTPHGRGRVRRRRRDRGLSRLLRRLGRRTGTGRTAAPPTARRRVGAAPATGIALTEPAGCPMHAARASGGGRGPGTGAAQVTEAAE